MTCQRCEHVFDAEMVMEAPITVVIASLESVSCPACGARDVGLGGEHKDKPDGSVSILQRASWWRGRGAVGTSSETIYCAMTGDRAGRYDYPYDPADYHRCRKLLDLIPEWRSQLHMVVERFPWWAPFAKAWDEFDRLFDEEFSSGRCPKLYAAMQRAREAADRIRERKNDDVPGSDQRDN